MQVLVVCMDGNQGALAGVLRAHGLEAVAISGKALTNGMVVVERPDVIVLRYDQPVSEGLERLRALCDASTEPGVLVVSPVGEVQDKVLAFQAGADDHVVEPFDALELAWRIRALYRRIGRARSRGLDYHVAGLRLLALTRTVTVGARQVQLTQTEFQILSILAESPDQAVTADALQERLWGEPSPHGLHALRVHVNRLRQQIEADPARPRHVVTVRGLGYALRAGKEPYGGPLAGPSPDIP